jgi:integrase
MPVYIKNRDLIYCVYYDSGKRIWEPFGRGPDAKKAAEARDLEIKLRKKRGQWNISNQRNSIPFIELAQAYINHRKIDLSSKTREGILRMLTKYVLPVIGTKTIHIINLQDWNKIQDKMMRGGAGPRSINTYFKYMNKLFKWSVVNEYLEEHPWKNRETLRHKKHHINLFTIEEFQKILDSAPEHLAWAMEVAYFTGMRPGPSELFALTWNNIDFKKNRIKIYATKTDSYRWQYVDPDFMLRMKARYIKNQQCGEPSPYVCAYHGQPVKSLKTAWKRAKEKAGITKKIRLYDIRHFYITYALANGANITELAERVGHVDATMIVKVYAHLLKDLKTKQAFEVPKLQFSTQTVEQTKEGLGGIS